MLAASSPYLGPCSIAQLMPCLGHPARSLLLELARQFVRDNNGRLLASRAYLAKRGWKSADVIDRAKRELLEAGIHRGDRQGPPTEQGELVRGHLAVAGPAPRL
jgi:hypothetical protein